MTRQRRQSSLWKRAGLSAAPLAVVLATAAPALAWNPLESSNSHVREGNEQMAAGKPAKALESYDAAARELPSSPGVHLDRGIALMARGHLDKAQQALLLAAEPPATAPVRADAYYDLGLAFYRQGDATAKKKQYDQAQKLFREAADAFKRSLRAKPGNRDAAWNLELASRRIREQKKKSQQQKQQQKQKQKQQQNQQKQQSQQQNQDQNGQQKQQGQKQGQQNQKQQQKQKQQPNPQQQKQQQKASGQSQQPHEKPLPKDARRVLDALQSQEGNFWRHQAQMRGQSEQREPAKDW